MSVAAVVLAAGASRRLGRPKQSVEIEGETLLQRAVRLALQAGLSPVIVVVRERAMAASLQGCEVLVNESAEEGMSSSIRCGIALAEVVGAMGAVVMACDQVALRSDHLRELYADSDCVTGSGYAGKIGVPAYFPARCFADLMKLQGEVGARELLRDAGTVVDEGLLLDIDTEADVERAKKHFM